MKVVKPTPITSAMLVSTTATETHSAWSSGTTYALDDYCILTSTQRVYQCIQGPSTNNPPDTSPLYWSDKGPTNKWAAFDSQISTVTTGATGLTVVLDTGYINSLALFGLVGSSVTIIATNGAGGPTVYSRTVELDGTIIADWYQYFFEPSVQLGELVLTDIPPYIGLRLTVTLTGTPCAIGHLAIGTFYDLGLVEYGAQVGIISFGRKDTSATGITTFRAGPSSKRTSLRFVLPNAQLNKVRRVLASLDNTPCAWVGVDDTTYTVLTLFGFFRDFNIEIPYLTKSFCSIELEELT